jgi:hypothetical protein
MEPFGSIKDGGFLYQLKVYHYLKEGSAAWSYFGPDQMCRVTPLRGYFPCAFFRLLFCVWQGTQRFVWYKGASEYNI